MTTRRRFLAAGAAGAGWAALRGATAAEPAVPPAFLREDLHVHLDHSTIEQVAALGRERGVKFGIVEHAGTKENDYPVVLSNDEELLRFAAMLEGHGVYKGIQAEWTDWMTCFSKGALAKLDFVLTDAMTFPGRDGRRVKLWTADAAKAVDFSDEQAFMDRFTDWHVEIIEKQPIHILANTAWLPAPFAEAQDRLWTEARVAKIAAAALKKGVALEISSRNKLPRLPFLRQVRAAGVKFTLGSNGRHPDMGKLDYAWEMARELNLSEKDLFSPSRRPRPPA